jgi:ATP-dependent RNA helicase RhlB
VKKSPRPAATRKDKTARPIPETPELFEQVSPETDVAEVSIFPALGSEKIDPEQAEYAEKLPPEFKNSDVIVAGQEPEGIAPVSAKTQPAIELEDITFSYLGFSDQILEAVRKQKYEKPTRVQALCLPHTLDGKDVAGFAQTGTGKTAVYLLTAAHKLLSQVDRQLQPNRPHALVIVPTRELADQVSQDAKRLFSHLNLKSIAVFGGTDVERNVTELNQEVDLVVATPGRLLDLHRSKKLELDSLQLLIIDECDRMFDMGFIDDVEYVLRHLPTERVQKLLFSATGSEKVKELAFEYLENPEYIETDPVRITPEKITQVAYAVTAEEKFLTLMGHIRAAQPECGIIFTNTKVVAEWIGYKLASNGLAVEVLTGDIPQRKRMSLIKKIKEGKCNLLVATDVLSRGLHVANLSHVYNFDIPDDAESFIHRIGRTARAGATGHAITLICDDYGYNMGAVEKLLGFSIPLQPVPQSFLQAEDKSDYPFDSSGRVKVFGQTYAATESAEAAPTPIAGSAPAAASEHAHHKRPEKREEISLPQAQDRKPHAERPEPTLPHPRRDTSRSAPHAARPHQNTERPTSAAAAQGPTPQPNAPRPVQGHHGQAHMHAASKAPQPAQATQAGLPRRDDKAKETVELAIQAAKKAAARRQEQTGATTNRKKPAKSKVTEQIDEIAAAVISGAQEKLGGAIGNLQDRFASRFEENFPRLSETLVRLGFFSKRFTEDR